MKSSVSIIIPVYNEAKFICQCLDSLAHQTLKPDQIIVVDDGSTDTTIQGLSGCTVVKQPHQGAGAARNLGATLATGEILVFVDADMEFSPEFLDHLTAPIRQGKTRGTFSKDEYVKNWDNSWARTWNYCLGLTTNKSIPENFPGTSPVFRAILKSEFDRVGGFDQTRGYDDDWSLSEKLGYRATIAPDAIYYHSNPDSFGEIFRQARWRATRKYKFGTLGKILTFIKIRFVIFNPPFNLTSFPGKIAFIIGTQIGLIFPRIRK